jgi:hypothetical protein
LFDDGHCRKKNTGYWYREHGLRMVGSPPKGLVRGSDKTSAQLNTAHRQICIPAMWIGWWKVREPILKVPMDMEIHGLEGRMGSPYPWPGVILNQGVTAWYTAMVYNHGIQGG